MMLDGLIAATKRAIEHAVSSGQVREIGLTMLVAGFVLAVATLPSFFLSLRHYFEFYSQHTSFYINSPKLKHRTLYMRLPVPWPAERTYYLLDHRAMKKLFASTPALDAFALARRLHYVVWGVPPEAYRPVLRQAAKDIQKALSARSLGAITLAFEQATLEDIAVMRKQIGASRQVPFHTTLYRLAYSGNIKSVFGKDLPIDDTRIPLQTFAMYLRYLNTTPSLPILPTEWWNKLIPGARKGAKARDAVTAALAKWELEGGLKTCSDTWRACFQVVRDNNVPYVHAARWVNMVLFGFTGNTGEQPGWTFIHLLQSPKLWAIVKAEVDALPSGSLVDVDFKRQTPYMRSAIQETLRLCTAVFAGRSTTQETTIEGCDTVFPKGVLIRTMSRAASFDAETWGDDPECWKGDRFVLNPSLYGKELHFGGGVSACPGRHFADAELNLITAHIIANFDFVVPTLHMEKKLLPDAPDMALGGPTKDSYTYPIIDVDGTRITAMHAGIADADNCMESVSGSIFPLVEAVIEMRCRDI